MKSQTQNTHGGDAAAVAKLLGLETTPAIKLDFSVNVNPLGPPDCVRQVLACGLGAAGKYPPVHAGRAVAALARAHDIKPSFLTVGNGSTEVMSWILQGLNSSRPAWVPPCYAGYREVCRANRLEGLEIPAMNADFSIALEKINQADADLLFLGSPNNPTGSLIDPEKIMLLTENNPEKWIVLDESFMDFMQDTRLSLISNSMPRNLIVVKSLTKFFAIPGLRIGIACANPEIIMEINRSRLPWSVNALAQEAATQLYNDKDYIRRSREATDRFGKYLANSIDKLPGWKSMPSSVNFILVKPPDTTTPSKIQRQLLDKGILVRSCADFKGLGQYIRLAVRPMEETDQLIDALIHSDRKAKNRYRSLMITGTTSDAGKSVIAAGICRLLKRRNIRVAPFKAQNMALNSGVTREGGEMGRAQIVQAKAAEIEPHTDMNPVLLKPMGDKGSQVIVNGKPIGNFPARDYYQMKERMKNEAHRAFDRLACNYEVIIMEGAGSPAEINLMEEDFVNMSMAEYAGARVILVADIDRGGVFASIYGTIQLLPENYRKLIRGVIINKFRGDESLLEPGISQIENLTDIPVLGVMPYIHDLKIEDEDSLGLNRRTVSKDHIIDIAVIRLQRISNYTDFLPLENTLGVSVRYVSCTGEIGEPDLVILPGTKNTLADLKAIQDSGMADTITNLAAAGIPVFGICGGYQMLGCRIADPSGVEGEPGQAIGLNLLELNTTLESKKELARVEGRFQINLPFARKGTAFAGYEIHSGRSNIAAGTQSPLLITRRRSDEATEPAGSVADDASVFGCYIHGLFDSQSFREQVLDWLCARRNAEPQSWHTEDVNDFDQLADLIESRVNLSCLEIRDSS